MRDDDKAEEIFQHILKTIKPYQSHADFANILVALQDAYSFQMALACPICRKRLASQLRQNIPALLVKADRLYASGPGVTCNLH